MQLATPKAVARAAIKEVNNFQRKEMVSFFIN